MLTANGLGQAGAAIVAARAVEFAFSRLGPTGTSPVEIVSVGLILAVTVSGTAWLRARERVDAERLGQSYTHDLRMELFARLTAMSPRSLGSQSQGSTVLRFIGDLSDVRRWVSLGLSRLCVAGTMAVATIVALGVIDPTLAAATGIAAVIGGLGAVAEGPKLRLASRDARRRRTRLAGRVTEVVATVGVVQVNNAVDRERRRVAKHSRLTRDAMIERSRRVGRLDAIAEATGSGATAMLLLAALSFGIDGPRVAASITVVGLLVPQLRGLARVQEYRQGYRVAMDAIDRFAARPTLLSEPTHPEPLNNGPGYLELRGASLGIVRDVTAVAHAGQTVAIVGPNGAGKSTLLAMIGRLVDLDCGSVLLDGSNLAQVRLAESRAVIGMAGPDLPLMRGSLRRNLTYHDPNATLTAINVVIDLCGLRQLFENLDDGFDTRIDEGGTNLSSGQRQRILLARAVLARPRLLLLDEADANLDAVTTGILDTVLAQHEGSALIVTHRIERVRAADEVWYLAGGRLVETGPPTKVLTPGHHTAQLFHIEARPDRVPSQPDPEPGATSTDSRDYIGQPSR